MPLHCPLPAPHRVEIKADYKASLKLICQQKCQVVLMFCWLWRHSWRAHEPEERVNYNKGVDSLVTLRKNLPWEFLKLVSRSCAASYLFCPFLLNIFELLQNSYHNFTMEDRAMRKRSFNPYLQTWSRGSVNMNMISFKRSNFQINTAKKC